jgi:predicted DNA-binding antitoxin AbrB/MazE fold protein
MGEIEAIYEDGVLRIVKPAKIESDVVTVRILNKDEMLTEEDMKDILNAMDEREKGNYYKLKEVFGTAAL